MNCNCQWTETILAIVILLFTFWAVEWSQWVISLAALVLLIHAWMCKSCMACDNRSAPSTSGKGRRRK